MKVPNRVKAALEKVFAAEIEGRLPFHSRAKIYQELCERGLLQPMDRRLDAAPPFPAITVSGYELTHAGRYLYGKHCQEAEE